MPEIGHIPYPRQVILVSCEGETELMGKKQTKHNIITLSWHSPVSFNPPLYAISVGKQRFSYGLIKNSGVFCVNFMPFELKDKVLFCGRNSGAGIDKFAEAKLTRAECEKIECPRIKEAASYLECEIVNEIEAGDHVVFIGSVLNSVEKKTGRRIFQVKGDEFTTTEQ